MSASDSASLDYPDLPHALAGERHELAGRAGRLSYYQSAPQTANDDPPLLLVHSINAAAGAQEMRPLFDYFAPRRPVYVLDLPGYGFSERSDRDYTPRLMTDALHEMLDEIRRQHGDGPIDALALSLSCEFLSRAVTEMPAAFRSATLVSPTAFNRSEPRHGEPGQTRGKAFILRAFKRPRFGSGLFKLLASRRSIRFFLQKTWGSKNIDETMFEYACLTTRQPGAKHAPFYFLSGYLFSADANDLYARLQLPVWMSHGVRGDFTDYRLKHHFQDRPNWQIRKFNTGALPYFELPEEFTAAYEDFLAAAHS